MKVKKVVIVGGVGGGASAAARVRRLDEFAQITIFEKGRMSHFPIVPYRTHSVM